MEGSAVLFSPELHEHWDYLPYVLLLLLAVNVTRKPMFMEKIVIPVFVAMVSFLSWSCSKILNATFESDAVNAPPATNLPGAPSGDVIEFHPSIAPG